MNLTKDERYYEQDIDFIAMKNDEPVKIEVKGSNYSRSFFVETEVFNKYSRTRKDGWLYKCQADYLFIVDMKNGFLYVLLLEDLKDYLKRTPTEEKKHEDKNQITKGRVIRIDDLKEAGKEVQEINVNKLFP